MLLISWFSHKSPWLRNLHIATAEIHIIPRDPNPTHTHTHTPYFCTLVIFFYLAIYSRYHLFNSLHLLPPLAVHSSTMGSCVLRKVSTSHSPLLLWFPLKAPHLRSMVWKALRRSAASHLCKVYCLPMCFWILRPPCLGGILTVLTAKDAEVQKN